MDSIELGGERSPDIGILGIEGLLEGFFGLSQRFCLFLVGLDVRGEIVKLFLREGTGT